MSKVDSLTSEPAPGIDRRGLLCAVGGVAAAGALSTAALALPAPSDTAPSAELLAWRKARPAYWCACERVAEFVRGWLQQHPRSQFANDKAQWAALTSEPRQKSLSRAQKDAEKTLDASVAAIKAKPIRSWRDVAELAEVVRGEMRWNPGERDKDDDNAAEPEVAALFDAIAMMARKGGADV